MAPDSRTPAAPADMAFDNEQEQTDDRSRMSFLEHLDELRKRILYSVYALLAVCFVTFWYWQPMFEYLAAYFQRHGGEMIYSQPMSGFMFSLKISALAGLIITSPFLFMQAWLFVAPGLYAREKKVVIPFVICSSLLFAGGAVFAHQIAFPLMWKFFASYQLAGVKYMPTLDYTFSFYVKIVIGLGLVFQMPILVFFLARFGLVTAKFLVAKFKYAVLIIFIIAAVVTPSADVVSQAVIAGPMLVLYGVSIVVAWVFGKKRKPEQVG
jgi:sec-independent protein translocase protein TatC